MSFLSLPSELRVQIYTLILVQDEPLEFIACQGLTTLHNKLSIAGPSRQAADTALLLVSKAIHAEAASILYGENIFIFSNGRYAYENPDAADIIAVATVPCFASFAHRIGASNTRSLRHIGLCLPTAWETAPDGSVAVHGEYAKSLEFIAASCPAVRTLELRSRDYLFLPSNPMTPEKLRAIDAVCTPSLERIVITSDENGPWFDEVERLRESIPGPRWELVVRHGYTPVYNSSDTHINSLEYDPLCRYEEEMCARELRRKVRPREEWADMGEWPPEGQREGEMLAGTMRWCFFFPPQHWGSLDKIVTPDGPRYRFPSRAGASAQG
jgi:hypothetical protein